MNRRSRLKFLCTPRGMRTAALIQRQRRSPGERCFVVGGLRMVKGRIVLHAVAMGDAYNIPRDRAGAPLLTDDARSFYEWRTRQAATQFRDRWGLADLHVYDLGYADVLDLR